MSNWGFGRNWRVLAAILAIVVMALTVVSPTQAAITGSITALNGAVTLPLPGAVQTVLVQATGTWTATISPEGSVDSGVTWFSIPMAAYTSAAQVTTATANGQWAISASGLDQIRIRASGFTSGTISVALASSTGTQTLTTPTAAGSSNVNLTAVGGTSLSGANVVDVANTAFRVNCITGCAGSSFTDNSAFTAGTSTISNIGGVFNDGLAGVTSGNAANPRITAQRGLHVNLRNNAGTETGTSGTPLRVDPTGVTTQPVSGTVTANAGTNLNTSALALDASVAGILRAQGSTTSGQTAPLVQGAVTTAAPSYTTAQTSPLSLTTAGLLRVDGSGVTQPVSGTVTANAGTNLNTSLLALDTSVNGVLRAQGSTTSGQTGPLAQAAVTTAAPSYTTGQTSPFSLTIAGLLRVDGSGVTQPVSGTVTANQGTPTNWAVNLAQVGAAAFSLGSTTMSASLSEAPASDYIQCTSFVAINQTAGTDLITPGSGNKVYICSIMVVSATAQSISVVEGTGTVCATGIAAVMGGTTSSIALAANGGYSMVAPMAFIRTATATDHLCLLQSGAGNVSGVISYRAVP